MIGKQHERPPDRIEAHLLIVEARFYQDLTDELVRGAIHTIEASGATWERLTVPGALEVPGAIAKAARTAQYDGYVALGVVLRGETAHYDIVAGESARGLMDLTLQGLSIGNGIITCETQEQAWARARVNSINKGGSAAEAALKMIEIERAMIIRGKKV
ncbi:MAG TPA: 6,7-dimethyl-8-ribityllumazine synthase [Aestuariivirgaceae bacterium]|nr:6,7-dimethyl-8-ribityllumazine synthase [Aestuariivirgaceae bacterium]